MKPRIAFIGHPLMTKICENYFAQNNLEDIIDYYEASFGQLDPIMNKFKKEGNIDAIVTGWGHSSFLKDIGLPVVTINITGLDILEGLRRAKELDNKVVFIKYGLPLQVKQFASLVDMEIVSSSYTDRNDTISQIEKHFQNGYKTFICTSFPYEIVNELGGNAIYIYSVDSITNAIKTGLQIADSRRIEIKKAEQFRIILENAQEGILTINSEDKTCINANPRAMELLNLNQESIIKQSIQILWPMSNIINSITNGEKNINVIESVSNREFIANYIPVLVDNKVECLVITFQDIDAVQKAEQKIRKKIYAHGNVAYYNFSDIIGKSEIIRDTIRIAKVFSKSDSTVLITGESGSGKELFAQSIHSESQRSLKPFVAINCGALPEDLLESELFGYEEGAFTGAKRGGHPGLFEIAHEGTLFLDEIGEISTKMQTRLLRVIQEKKLMRVGGRDLIPVDVRILAATNRNLKNMVEVGSFRQDLYFRLNVLHLIVPPLRQRKNDILCFLNYFCKHYNAIQYIDEVHNVLKQLNEYDWPGNVRELENIVERIIVVLREEDKICEDKIFSNIIFNDVFSTQGTSKELTNFIPNKSDFKQMKRTSDKELIQKMLKTFNGNKSLTAKQLGISRSTLYKKLNI